MSELQQTKVLRCLDCGKCTSVCPVARYNHALSPRRLMRRLGGESAPGLDGAGRDGDGGLWSCLTCMQCDARCPQEVSISTAMPHLRRLVRENGARPPATRCAAIDSVAALQSRSSLPQSRMAWLRDDVNIDPASKTLLWVGCAPYFDVFFKEKGVDTTKAVIAAIRILNALGMAPRLLADERCCGHDALWGGDEPTFERLAARNVQLLQESDPELVVSVCPECTLTLVREYQRRFGVPAGRVVHISELIAERAAELKLTGRAQVVTFQDPCRLGRHQERYEQPRRSLGLLPGLELREMARNRKAATCCAGNWLACSQATKRIQVDRLQEAAATGSETLVTACPKCLIHFKCAQHGDGAAPQIAIRDLTELVAAGLNQ